LKIHFSVRLSPARRKSRHEIKIVIKKSRYGLIFIACAINFFCFTLLRSALYAKSWNSIDHSLKTAFHIFSLGFFYDAVFNIYFGAFFAVFLLITPNKVFNSRAFKWLGHFLFTLFLCALYFTMVSEWLFWDEFGTRFNFIAVDYLVYGTELSHNMYESYPVVFILAGIVSAALFTVYLLRRNLNFFLSVGERFRRRIYVTAALIIFSVASFFLVGQAPRDSLQNNFAREIASNGPYQIVAAFRNNTLDYETFYVCGESAKLSRLAKKIVSKAPEDGSLFDISRRIDSHRAETELNVILVSVESLSAEFLARFGNTKNITPFLDSLSQESLLFTNLFATGTRTDRGLEAITLSVPPTPGRSLVKRPDNAHILSLGYEFEKRGYDVAFLYGGRGYFDNMNAFFSGNGYRIIDQTDLKNDEITFSNAWGVADEDLYRKTLQEAGRVHEKGGHFFYHVMTTSNHRPFTYPEGKIDIRSGTGRAGAVKYTDFALGEFFSAARKQPWFDNTVFVVVADHCAGSAGEIGLPIKKYHIPLIIYSPKHIIPGEVAKVASQVDIAPTLLALLGFSYESYFWGKDIMSSNFEERALIGNYQKLGLYKNEKLLILSPRKKIEVMDKPFIQNVISENKSDDPLSLEAIAYYQGADYILKHKLNRWEYAESKLKLYSAK